jgi:RNA polymerase sigma-70 factor, ECF subfamily
VTAPSGGGTLKHENALAGQPTAHTRSLNAELDESLIKAIATGGQRAMRALYRRHNLGIFRFISRLIADAGDAEDLVSEVFIDVWKEAGI